MWRPDAPYSLGKRIFMIPSLRFGPRPRCLCCAIWWILKDIACWTAQLPIRFPLERSVCDGHEYNVVVLTRDITYRKKEKSSYPKPLVYAKYRGYPNLISALESRGSLYNRQVEYVLEQERRKKSCCSTAKPADRDRCV